MIRPGSSCASGSGNITLSGASSPPPGLVSREWGFIFYDDTPGVAMRRHKAFNSEGELKDYLASMPPAHAYHSAAYYQYPQAPTMLEKKWLGADLIFDLDADHLPGVKNMSYSEMLANVKKEIIRLIDEFLIDDLGFREKDMDIVFSGGRGYHVHVRDPRVHALKSPERREIVDYLLGTGLDSITCSSGPRPSWKGRKARRRRASGASGASTTPAATAGTGEWRSSSRTSSAGWGRCPTRRPGSP